MVAVSMEFLDATATGTNLSCYIVIIVLIVLIVLVSTERTGSLLPATPIKGYPAREPVLRTRVVRHAASGRFLAAASRAGRELLTLQVDPFVFDCDMMSRLSVLDDAGQRWYVAVNQPPARENTYLALDPAAANAVPVLPAVAPGGPLRVLDPTGAALQVMVRADRLLLWSVSADAFVG